MPITADAIAAAFPDAQDTKQHDLTVFLNNFMAARDLLVEKRIEQRNIAKDGGASQQKKAKAQKTMVEVIEAIAELDEAQSVFLVRVFTHATPPSPALVARTIQLNKEVAAQVVKNNLPGVYLKIVTAYVNAAVQVITGTVPAAPAPAPAPATP